jgi:hypothetical protein
MLVKMKDLSDLVDKELVEFVDVAIEEEGEDLLRAYSAIVHVPSLEL